LPNSPSLIYPGRNPSKLLSKRNHLLNQLHRSGVIDFSTCELAKAEPLPQKPYPLPQLAPHLVERAVKDGQKGTRVRSTLSIQFQQKVNDILSLHYPQLKANEIGNAAAIVLEVSTGNVIAYAGNIPFSGTNENGQDIIMSPRSTGSILKPFLYAAMLNDGLLLPGSLVPDIPMQIGGFIPENYSLTYDGAVPARRALARSLNIPAVKMLQSYGYDQFCTLLRRIGMTTLSKPADHYGLSLILGGAEADLWDLAGIYASLARTLNHFNETGKYDKNDFHPANYLFREETSRAAPGSRSSVFDAASIYLTFEAMVEVARPDEELQWRQFSSSSRIAWKTGTSFGNRDAWSVGVTPGYVVAVWVGSELRLQSCSISSGCCPHPAGSGPRLVKWRPLRFAATADSGHRRSVNSLIPCGCRRKDSGPLHAPFTRSFTLIKQKPGRLRQTAYPLPKWFTDPGSYCPRSRNGISGVKTRSIKYFRLLSRDAPRLNPTTWI
jgi:penicillin-binding protein 1C